MKNVCVFRINKMPKTTDKCSPLDLISLNEKEENLLFRLIRKLGGNYHKIASKFNRGSRIKFTPNQLRDLIESKTFKFNSKKNYWSPEEERILLEKHKIFGNKWSKISSFLNGRSDNNIKNFFYSKFRRVLRRIIKDIYKDKSFFNNYVETGLVSESNITVNFIYKILKQNDIIFEKVNKDIVLRLLAFNEQVINNNQPQQNSKTENSIFANFDNNNCNNLNSNTNPHSFQDSTKENNENEYLEIDFVKIRKQIHLGETAINCVNKLNHKINFDQLNKSSSFYSNSNSVSNSNSNSNSQNTPTQFVISLGNSQEKTKFDCINNDTISETSGREKDSKSGSDLVLQKALFDKELNFLCGNEKKGKRIENREVENSNDEVFSFLNENEDRMHDCFSYLSL